MDFDPIVSERVAADPDADIRVIEAAVDGASEALKPLFYAAAFYRLPDDIQDMFYQIAFRLGCATAVGVYRSRPAAWVEVAWQERLAHGRAMLAKIEAHREPAR